VIRSADSCVGDENIDWPKLFTKTISSFSYGFRIADVRRRCHRLDVSLLRLVYDFAEKIFAARQQRELPATRGNLQRETSSDPGRGPGNHHDFIGKISAQSVV